jgi:parallel beta-helix repeat protein
MEKRLFALVTILLAILNCNSLMSRSLFGNFANVKSGAAISDDAGINSIATTICSGTQNLQVSIKNYGSTTLTSCTINWSIDGIHQAPYSWTGTLLPLTTANIVPGTTNFTFSKHYTIKAWTNLLNDSNNANDTFSVTINPVSLNGTYTVGGNTPDFKNLKTAIDTLTKYGICGPVILNLRNGIYTDKITIPSINGSSATNALTIQSESGDNTAVILTDPSLQNVSSPSMVITGAKYLTIRKLTIRNRVAGQTNVVFASGTSNLTLSDNILEGVKDKSTADLQAVIKIKDGVNSAIMIENNQLLYGSEGIHLELVQGVTIKNNKLLDQYAIGIWLYQCINNPLIEKNIISSSSANDQYTGVRIIVGSNERINKNQIICANGTGLSLYSKGSSSNKGLISNNYIEVNGLASEKGIFLDASRYQNVYNNSVNVKSTGSESAAIYLNYGSNINLKNNIFSAEVGYALFCDTLSNTLDTSNYNGFYTRGTTLALWNHVAKTNLIAYQTASGKDANSVVASPNFAVNKKYVASSMLLNNAGIKINQIPDDIEGKLRNATTPDIGACEFTSYTNDAGVDSVNPNGDICFGSNAITAIIKNYGSNPITKATINWSVNGVLQTPYSWTGNLAPGNASALLNIGSYNATGAPSKNIVVWTSLPSGNADPNSANDSAIFDKSKAKLFGTYTIGGTSPDFSTFGDATEALVQQGICGPVIFNVRSFVYYENAITIPFIQGSSAINTITFQSETGKNTDVVLSDIAGSVCLTLDKAKYIRLKNISFRSTGSPGFSTTVLVQQTRNIEFSGNKFEGPSWMHLHAASKNHGLTITNNVFEKGTEGIYVQNPNDPIYTDSLITISGNTLINQSNTAIFIGNSFAPVVSTNIIKCEKPGPQNGIRLNECVGAWKIEKNNISGAGITTYYCKSTAGARGTIANNFASILQNSVNTIFGINSENSSYINIFNNNVLVNTNPTNPLPNAVVNVQEGKHFKMVNNNFINRGSKYVYSFYPDTLNPLLVFDTIDYNNIQSTSPQICNLSTSYTNLNTWQASGFDQHSITVDPYYLSDKDLHVLSIALKGKGKSLAGITDDIDGEPRALTPDIGADEFTLAPNDAGIFAFIQPQQYSCPGTKDVNVQVRNYGMNNLTSATINWELNGVLQTSVPWTGNLVTGESDTFKLSTSTFLNGVYSLKAWTTKPNMVTDIVTKNDSAFIPPTKTSLNGNYTVGGTSPDFETINNAVTYLKENGVCGPVVFNIRKAVYNERIALTKINGASSVNTIIFQSQTGFNGDVMIQANTDDNGFVLKLEGSGFISFKNLSFKTLSTSTSSGKVIGFLGKVNNTRMEGCILYGSKTIGSSGFSVIYSANGNDRNTIINNTIINGSYGIFWDGDINNLDDGLLIQGNRVKDGNGIFIINSRNMRCLSNEVTSSSVNTAQGMTFAFCTGFEISKNKVKIAKGSGIDLSSCEGKDTSKLVFANNFVTVSDATFGLKISRCSYLETHYNSIQVASKGDALQIGNSCINCKPVNLYDNIFSNIGGGYAVNVQDKKTLGNSNYNCLYTSGSSLAYYAGVIGSLAVWETVTKLDANSISSIPGFISVNDLHVNANSAVSAAGKSFILVSDDIDGDIRNALHPYIGADEFNSKGGDAGIVKIDQPDTICYGLKDVIISIKNYDTDTLKHAVISWDINGVVQNDYSWTGKLAPGGSVNAVNIGSYAFNTPSIIRVWTVGPNGGNDKNTMNDTSKISKKASGAVTLDLGSDTSYVCGGESIILSTGSGYTSYIWSNGQGVLSNASAYTVNTRGKYILTVTNANGCIGKDSVFVIMKDDSFTRTNFSYINAYSSNWMAVAWMDYNVDDNEDIGLFTADDQVGIVATNKGKGKFETQYLVYGGSVSGASWADADNDGDVDATYNGEEFQFIIETAGGVFKTDNQGRNTGFSTSWVDYDNDGKLDIAVTQSNGATLLKDHGINGSFYFLPDTVLPYNGYAQTWIDYDNDGDQDWFFVGSYNSHLFANDGKGNFTETIVQAFGGDLAASYAKGASWGDYDNDGDMDLFKTEYPNNFLYQNNGNGTFTKVTNAGSIVTDKKSSAGSAWGDYDNDGYLDLFVNNQYNSPDSVVLRSNTLYHNNGDGTFTENKGKEWNTSFSESWRNNNCAWGDVDNDGDIDLVQGAGYQVNVYTNNGNCRNWLTMKLTGTISNRSAIGAKVYLYTVINGKAQVLSREISGQTGFNGQNSLRIHFGLGKAAIIDSIKIIWPSGIKKVMKNVSPNQYLKITEECDNTICENVWPGDANSDLAANNKDLLSVGLYYTESGTSRDSISNIWIGQKAKSWGKFQYNGSDMKHADCNGDGMVNDKDTVAIVLNYGLQHKRNFVQKELNAANPDLYFVPSKTTANPGDWIDVAVWAGTSTIPVTDLYGLAFDIGHHTNIIESGSVSITYPTSWLATPLVDAIRISKIIENYGMFDGAISRIDHQNKSGYGKIAVLRFRIKPSITTSQTLQLDITDYAAVDVAGHNKSFNALSTSILIVPLVTGLNAMTAFSDFEVHPNPFMGQTKITYTLNADKNVSLELYNMLGQKMETFTTGKQSPGKYTYTFSTEGKMADNIFIVKLVVGDQILMKRIISVQ